MRTSPIPEEKRLLIRASELAQYGFCQRAWWLGAVEKRPNRQQTARTRGIDHHQQHAHQLRLALKWRRIGYLLLAGGSTLMIITWLWFWFL